VTLDRSAGHTGLPDVRLECERRLADPRIDATRRALLEAAIANAPAAASLPVAPPVLNLLADELRFIATADEASFARQAASAARLERLRHLATLKRFPAGQFEWEVSGIPRGYIARVGIAAMPRVLWFAARRMRGLAPVFFSHLNPRRRQRSLSELEANRSYHRMAQPLERQPQVRGFAACSWFRSPATHRVSPHLAWVSRVFLEHGGLVVEAGRDDPDSGVLARSATRRALYEAGRFVPTRGLVMWPRDAMIAWARSHPEYGD
jgi:hypothetical protein